MFSLAYVTPLTQWLKQLCAEHLLFTLQCWPLKTDIEMRYTVYVFRYKRRFQKKKDRWSIYVSRELKKYTYISDLQSEILDERIDLGKGMSRKQPMSETDPRRLGLLPRVPPVPTNVLVLEHRSRIDESAGESSTFMGLS